MPPNTECDRLEAARKGNQQAFGELAEPYRRELRAYCYRMLGSLHDAEDMVQETMLQAWRRLETYEGRASFRAWLYKIATNACLDALDKASRRVLPTELSDPADPSDAPREFRYDPIWLEPLPEEWLNEAAPSAESYYTQRESVTMAFMTALHILPPRQRATLLLCDVLDWRVAEAATFLDMTISAAESALHRARSSLARNYRTGGVNQFLPSPRTRDLLERYVKAWEAADVAALVTILRDDAIYTMPPALAWYSGKQAIGDFFRSDIFLAGLTCRLLPVGASGCPGFAMYLYDSNTRRFQSHSIHVLQVEDGYLSWFTMFINPALFPYFDLPEHLD